MIVVAAVAAAVWTALMVRVELVVMRMYQLEEYDARRLFRWALATPKYLFHIAFALLAGFGLLGMIVAAAAGTGWFLPPAAGGGAVIANAVWRWPVEKKPLVRTARARRLIATSRVVTGLVAALAVAATWLDGRGFALGVLAVLAPLLGAAILVLSNAILWPYELRSRSAFRRAAANKLAAVAPTVVAVAGSYGKTTTKGLIAQALDRGGDTLPTPKSFNTLLGLTKTINDDLTPAHKIFVAEMDAYNPGEIRTMCALTKPAISVLASVGPMHLERFKSLDRIADALFEVVTGLREDGTAIVCVGSDAERNAVERARQTGRRTVSYGDGEVFSPDVLARDISLSIDGTRFTFEWEQRKISSEVFVPLLGRHQALNATAALIVALELGRDLAGAIAALAHAPTVEHRLQVIPSQNGVTVIDDSYNANPVGVHNALEILQALDVRKRILVTPGLVELGSLEYAENRRYGEHAARVCDDLIVVRARTTPALLEGAREAKLDDAHIHVVGTLDEATGAIGRLAAPGDVVLFANDLPDTY
jgi:UDP-N-acetylmuramoyl-tripeptide--D-alanyl-D-alanine ligase